MQQTPGSQDNKSLLLIKENQTSQVKEFSAFISIKVQESGLTEIIPLMRISALWGQGPVLSHPGSAKGVLSSGVSCRG